MNRQQNKSEAPVLRAAALALFTVVIAPLSVAQTADYGDAPDMAGVNQFGPASGHYPTLNPTGNTAFPGRTGPHHLSLDQEVLGARVDAEGSARVVNGDWFDDGFKNFFFLLAQIPVPTYMTVEITIPGGASAGPRYVNVASDFNQDGKWQRYLDVLVQPVDEWVVRNHVINVPADISPGQTKSFVLPAFGWGSGLLFAYPTWFRVTLAEGPLNAPDFGLDGWDGSGPGPGFPTGETEDYFWRGYGIGIAPGGGSGNEGEVEGESEGEGEGEGEKEGEGTGEGEEGEPCDDVEIVWMPRIVPLGQEGARFCIRICNNCPTDVDVSITWQKVEGNNVGTTQAPDPATIPAGECAWVCFTSFWVDAEPVGNRLGRYRPIINVVSDKIYEKALSGDEVRFEDTMNPGYYSAPAQVQTGGGAALTSAIDLSSLVAPDALALLLPQVSDVAEIPDADQIKPVNKIQVCDGLNTVYHAVSILAPGPISPPALAELPISSNALLAGGCVLPVLYNPTTLQWEGLVDFYLREDAGLALLEVEKPGLYGLAGKMNATADVACEGTLVASEVVSGSGSMDTGTVSVQVDPLSREALFQVVHTVADVTSAAIHLGVSGEEGPILLDLGAPGSPIAAARTLTLNQLDHLLSGRLYVQLTSTTYPEGAIRGQLDCLAAEGEGEALEGEGDEGEGEAPEGESAEGDGESPEGEGDEGEGEAPEGEGGEGEALEGEGEAPEGEVIEGEVLEGEGEPVEGEEEPPCGCCRENGKIIGPQDAIQRMLADWLVVGVTVAIVLMLSAVRKF